MPTPGVDCHIVIDGFGYITAPTVNFSSEARQEGINESVAPAFGDPNIVSDQFSSDLTMLLPIGQNTFSKGIGTAFLEQNAEGVERAERFWITPKGTIISGPNISTDTLSSTPTDTASGTGFVTGIVANNVTYKYFNYGTATWFFNGSTWASLPATTASPTDLKGYAGKMVFCEGDTALQLHDPVNSPASLTAGTFNAHKLFLLYNLPFIIYRDGRVYASYLQRPPAPSGILQSGTNAGERVWLYVCTYVLPGSPDLVTELGDNFVIHATNNNDPVITLPTRSYRGGPVNRRLWRTKTNDFSNLYLLADTGTIGALEVRYVDTTLDTSLVTGYSFSNINNTAIALLSRGTLANNMAFADTDPLNMAEGQGTPSTQNQINNVVIYHDLQANEGAFIGTYNGLFDWNGVRRQFSLLKNYPYNSANFAHMVVQHGVVYFTIASTTTYIWNGESESVLHGPWELQFSSVVDVRLANAAPYLAVAVRGTWAYDGTTRSAIYLFDGTVFIYSYLSPASAKIIMGSYPNSNTLTWFETNTASNVLKSIALDPVPVTADTSGSNIIRSSLASMNLPRVRKQIHGVIVRYKGLTNQSSTTVFANVAAGSNTILFNSTAGFSLNDWVMIKNQADVTQSEFRQIGNIAGQTVTLSHPLGAALNYAHSAGDAIVKCGAICSIRNAYTTGSITNYTIGGPADSADSFVLINLPQPVYSYQWQIDLTPNSGVSVEILGLSARAALNPLYNGLVDVNLRLLDNVKLPNNSNSTLTAAQMYQNLKNAYAKGTVTVVDPMNNTRQMRFRRLSFDFEPPKERHSAGVKLQVTAHCELIDINSELLKQQVLTVQGIST